MSKTQGPDRNQGIRPNGRPTIGLLTARISSELGATFWNGVLDAAGEQGANLLAFAGGILNSPHGFEAQANVLYDLVGVENVDGLVIDGGLLSHYVGLEALQDFCRRYHDLPLVVVEAALPGIPCVLVDFYQGMHDVIAHLIETHGYRRIAFIRGPEESPTGEERYRAYTDALAEHGIPLEPRLVVPGTFFAPSGAEAIRLLLDERRVDLEAVAAANDFMALDAMQALQARGIRVPDDMAVAGFDDWRAARVATPPLTTAQLHNYERARRAAELLLAQLRGEEVPDRIIIPAGLVVRQSCGCPDLEVVQAAAGPVAARGEPLEAALAAQRPHILSAMIQEPGAASARTAPAWAERLLDACAAELTGRGPGSFLSTLAQLLLEAATTDEDLIRWNGVISTLRRHLLPCLSGTALSQAEDLWNQARVMIGEMAQRTQAYQTLQAQQQAQTLQDISQALLATFNLEELAASIAGELPRLKIPTCYLSLYADPIAPAEEARLILAYDQNRQLPLEAGGQPFPSRQLIPPGMWPQDRSYNMVVEPLYFREDQLGFVLFEVGQKEISVCDMLRSQISSAIQGALLVQQVENHALQLQTAAEISRATSEILEVDELLTRSVNLIRDRFDLYYVGLFLVERVGEQLPGQPQWATLRAGTGQAGEEMVKQKHKLQVGGQSMVGQCIAQGKACLAQDVGKEATYFPNPLLPETRSELALPLISRGEIVGALTIQSSKKAAFARQDIVALQTMAGQLANAIENARLFQQSKEALEGLKAIQRRYIREGWERYTQKRQK